MRCAISRACFRSCCSSSWKPAKTICSIQRIRPHGVTFENLGIEMNLPGTRSGNSAVVGGLGVGHGEERPDPARLLALQVDDHRESLLLLAAEAVGNEQRAAHHH